MLSFSLGAFPSLLRPPDAFSLHKLPWQVLSLLMLFLKDQADFPQQDNRKGIGCKAPEPKVSATFPYSVLVDKLVND